jgi:hypothetical protein
MNVVTVVSGKKLVLSQGIAPEKEELEKMKIRLHDV